MPPLFVSPVLSPRLDREAAPVRTASRSRLQRHGLARLALVVGRSQDGLDEQPQHPVTTALDCGVGAMFFALVGGGRRPQRPAPRPPPPSL